MRIHTADSKDDLGEIDALNRTVLEIDLGRAPEVGHELTLRVPAALEIDVEIADALEAVGFGGVVHEARKIEASERHIARNCCRRRAAVDDELALSLA